jgi:ribonuclease VapC
MARYGEEGVRDLELFLHAAGVRIEPVSRDQIDVATEGFRRYGTGRHVAALNYGDLFGYGLASLRAEPLLFVGDDFAKTDVTPALEGS